MLSVTLSASLCMTLAFQMLNLFHALVLDNG